MGYIVLIACVLILFFLLILIEDEVKRNYKEKHRNHIEGTIDFEIDKTRYDIPVILFLDENNTSIKYIEIQNKKFKNT